MSENAILGPRYKAWPYSYALYRAAKRARARGRVKAVVSPAIRQVNAVVSVLMGNEAAEHLALARVSPLVR